MATSEMPVLTGSLGPGPSLSLSAAAAAAAVLYKSPPSYTTTTTSSSSSSNSPSNYECRLTDYRGAKVASFTVNGKEMICLPQAFDLFLKHLVGGLHTVYTKLKRLEITPVVCNVEQVRILRGLGAIQPGVNRCKLITKDEFDILYHDCTTASSRPGRPPKRTLPLPSGMAAAGTFFGPGHPLATSLEFLKKSKLQNGEDFSPHSLMAALVPPSSSAAASMVGASMVGGLSNLPPALSAYSQAASSKAVAAAAAALSLANGNAQDILSSLHRHPQQDHQRDRDREPDDPHSSDSRSCDSPASPCTSPRGAAASSDLVSPKSSDSGTTAPHLAHQQQDRLHKMAAIQHSHGMSYPAAIMSSSGSLSSHHGHAPLLSVAATNSLFSRNHQLDANTSTSSNHSNHLNHDLAEKLGGAAAAAAWTAENLNGHRSLMECGSRAGAGAGALGSRETAASMETLLTNIQGLLQVAADNAKQQKKQIQMETDEMKMEIMKEREIHQSLEKQLASEQRNRAIIQKRLKKEKKSRRKLQEQLENEQKRRIQVEEALKGNSTDGLNDSLSQEIETEKMARKDAEKKLEDIRGKLRSFTEKLGSQQNPDPHPDNQDSIVKSE